jgi:uncharacterized protein YecE (DUF72 family)
MNLYVGTSGYSYKQWKGEFYPEDLPDKDMLKYYGTQLTSVEINNTFYRMPKEPVLKAWADQVPEDFRFSIKASQRITHFKRLNDAGDETEYLFRTVRILGEKLGVVLFQLPPNMKKDLPRLEQFLKYLPGDTRTAFEFRHPSWFEQDVFSVLEENACSLCIADFDEELQVPFVSTAGWGYLRLRREKYTPADMKAWFKRIADQEWKTAFVFFKHEDEATGPLFARRFIQIAETGGERAPAVSVKTKKKK